MIPERIKALASALLSDVLVAPMLGFTFTRQEFPTELFLTPKFFKRRIIWDRDGKTPYLARFYITPPPHMTDGTEAFDKLGNQRPGSITGEESWIPRVFVHHFYRGDNDAKLHSHPWEWALSLILAGGYQEELRTKRDTVRSKVFHPGMFNFLTKRSFHRVDLLDEEKGSWSIFVVCKRTVSWSFWDRVTKKVIDWKDYIPNEHKPEVRT